MRVSELEQVAERAIGEPAAVAAKWWADTLRDLLAELPDQPPPGPASTDIDMVDLIGANFKADASQLTTDKIDKYEHELALRIQTMLDSGEETATSIGHALTTEQGPSDVHKFALKAADLPPSITILPWHTAMSVHPKNGTVIAGSDGGWRQLHPPPVGEPSRAPVRPPGSLDARREGIRTTASAESLSGPEGAS
jgi:hypothetical protein